MKSWKELRDYLMNNYGTISEYDEEDDSILMTVPLENDRSQMVNIGRGKTLIIFSSLIGDIHKNDLKDALNDLWGLLYGKMCCDDDGDCSIVHCENIETLTENKIDTILSTIAITADELEEKYIGKDIY